MTELVYEYVIVGGGMAGLHVAKLLAKKYPDRSFCLWRGIYKSGSRRRI